MNKGDVVFISPIKYKDNEHELEKAFVQAKGQQDSNPRIDVIVCVTSSVDGLGIYVQNFVEHYAKFGKIPNCLSSGVKFC